ncbi:MAG: CidA/LrgA family protein [Pseudomonadota bacterium]
MQALRGLAWLLALQSIGELLARGLSLPFPGPVVGMMLLLAALQSPMVREPVAACADYLLSHLSLLFVPVGVGVMTHLSLLDRYGGRILVVIVLSTWVGLAVTVLTLHLLSRADVQADGQADDGGANAEVR